MNTADSAERGSPRYYPVALRIAGRRCLVVGGGKVAERKVRALLAAGGQVCVVSPELTPALQEHAARGDIDWHPRGFVDADLDDCWIVVGATRDPAVNQAVSRGALARGRLVNIVDEPSLCNFIVPASCELGPVTFTISTAGTSPALAGWLRKRLEAEYGPALGSFAGLLGEVRGEVKARVAGEEARRAVWEAILNSTALELVRQGRIAEARETIRACISSPSD